MKVVAIIQARMGGKRLPGKVMLPLSGKPMLWHIIERVKRAKLVDEVVVAVPKNSHAIKCNVEIIEMTEGVSDDDLITRYFYTAEELDADIIVRVCADNPCVEPGEIDRATEFYLEGGKIFVSNAHQHSNLCMIHGDYGLFENGYPDGIGCEVFSFDTLFWINRFLKGKQEREHLHKYFHDNAITESPVCPKEFARPDLKLDVNTQQDYEYIKNIYDNLYPKNPNFHVTDIIEFLNEENLV